MKKIIQIATSAAENGHSLYALTEDGKVYERVYYAREGVAQEWIEIEPVVYKEREVETVHF